MRSSRDVADSEGREDPPQAQFKNKTAIVAYLKKPFADGAAAIEAKGDKGILDAIVDPFTQDTPDQAGKKMIRLIDFGPQRR